MNGVVIETKDVHQTFMISSGAFRGKRPLHAVNGVSLAIERGERLGLVGESGCGKTTLAKIMLGMLKPTAGEVEIEGRPIETLDRLEVARMLQPIFQDPYSSLNPRKSVGSIISLPLRVQKAPRPETWKQRVKEMMKQVGLPASLYHHYPKQVSCGQRQRVAIARALVNRPQVVVCDEPTSALDVSVQSQILNLLQDLCQELSLTYVLITHNLAVVEHMATRVAVMYLGRIVEVADTQTLFNRPQHPYTRALLDSVLTPDPSLGVPDAQLGAAYPNPVDPPSGCAFHPRCPDVMAICKREAPAPSMAGGACVECHLFGAESRRLAS